MISVTYFFREPRKTGVSIEGIFHLVKNCLQGRVDIKEFYCDAHISRFKNILAASKQSNEINHITGDVNFLMLGLRGKKNILTIHDLGHLETLRQRSKIKYLVYKYFWLAAPLRYAKVVTVVSQFTKNKLLTYFDFPEEKIRVIYNPVKPVFKYQKKENIHDNPRILMLGTGGHKNLKNLIEAARGTSFHLDIVGWPGEMELGKLSTYDISHTLYNRLTDEEIYQRYVACDVLFTASFYEGFCMPIIEAQTVGRPVVTSNIGAMKEISGDTALLVDPHSPDEIRKAILSLINSRSLYDDVVSRGLENVKPYEHEYIAEQYLKVYEEIAN